MIRAVLYSRPDCPLCHEMKETLVEVAGKFPVQIEEVDISCDPHLETLYGQEIPVLYIQGRKAFKYRVTARELEKRLRQEMRTMKI